MKGKNMELNELIEELKKYIKGEDRFKHSIGVSKMAKELAKKYGIDEEKAAKCGLMHDMAKEISMIQRNEKGKQARQYFIEVEKELKQQLLPQTPEQQIALLAQGNVNLNKKVEQIENSVLDLTDRFGLPSNKAKVLQKKVASKVYMFTGGKYSNAHKKLGAKVFREFYKDLNNRFDVVK